MSQSIATINTRLLESLTQIILSLSQEEYQILIEKIQYSRLTEHQKQENIESLKEDIGVGIQELQNGQYTEYNENTLSSLITSIKAKGRERLQGEVTE
ncbi:MAG: hypothetical protein PX483_02520 [Nostocales cyanobacterium LE14-WE4]|jgi:hypothetical protein|nr:hypothetical protein [Anabaena sp. 49633_E8]MDD1413127.1 hypothetical protein [Dolichospermum sp. ST_con]MDD1418777.1 hypothetical protein [Dolichospermum sp. ST_sed1]MDD1423920.1 hypothetical protein [Dolichospermum sp. ST_sed9]MDD1430419.1 hypothetical protein [Dolichospermum sp. ST_sed6]MDD1435423.1 hypothetical protein [Dolichospermum sp. ST_sed10]MDD1439751.1 hypothetical protein [Dolichospermum sp. ST_sed3]MDD1445655.1 hypothetical protein [Dolichospermum sp. ST_sed8]MDD1453985.1 h